MFRATLVLISALLCGSSLLSVAQSPQHSQKEIFQFFEGLKNPITCILANCSLQAIECFANSQCRQAVDCNKDCVSKPNSEACNLLCELNYGYNSTQYRNMMQCMSDHGCLPVSPPDGKCLAQDTDTIQNLTSLAQMKGKWWILKGLNCGQPGWPAGFDYFPCQRDEFVFEGGHWVDHIAYCGGNRSVCSTPLLYTVANVSITKPGVMTHWYTDPPLKPQTEEWRVLSWPHPDWMLYIYCGVTPTGPYAGGSVVSRLDRPSIDQIPGYVELLFENAAMKFGFNYDTMCVSDVSKCMD